jgi:hypothetical protein
MKTAALMVTRRASPLENTLFESFTGQVGNFECAMSGTTFALSGKFPDNHMAMGILTTT